MKLLFIIPVLLAALYADAMDYDVSIITVNKVPTIEIVINDQICQFPTTQKELESFSKADAKRLVSKCLSK